MEWLDLNVVLAAVTQNFVNGVKTCFCISFEQSEKEAAQI
jgi:hypothetical protein